MEQDKDKEMGLPRSDGPRGIWLAWFVLAVGVILTVLVTLERKSKQDAMAEYEFTHICNTIQLTIEKRLVDQVYLLQSVRAFFNSSDAVSREEWSSFTSAIKVAQRFPSTQIVGFSLLIPSERLERHTQDIRAEGFPEYHVWPGGEREVYTSIVLLEPFSGRNVRAFGYDMFSESVRRDAMEMARDQGVPALSGKVMLVQETETDIQAGTLIYVPVYRKGMPTDTIEQRRVALYGWAYSAYRMNELMQSILDEQRLRDAKEIYLRVYDGERVSTENLLYSNFPADDDMSPPTGHSLQISSEIAERRWLLYFSARDKSIFVAEHDLVRLILLAGTIISLLAFWLVLSLLNTRFSARKMAEELTANLRVSEERYRILHESSRDAILTSSATSWRLTSANPAAMRMFGITNETELASLAPWDLSPETQPDGRPSREKSQEMTEKALREGSTFFEWQQKRYNGEEFPSTVLLTRVDLEGQILMLGTVRDITESKASEETLRASEEKFRRIVENMGIGVALISPDMRILEFNAQMKKWFPEIAVSDKPVLHMAFNKPSSEDICEHCPTAKTLQDGQVHEDTASTPQGNVYRIVSSPLHDQEGRTVAAIELVEDVTERLRLERDLRQAQRQESIGQLAAGIAHEINNPIQYIGNNTRFLQDALATVMKLMSAYQKLAEQAREHGIAEDLLAEVQKQKDESDLDYLTEEIPRTIQQTLEGVDSIAKIVFAMKEFSSSGFSGMADVDINKAIESTVTVSRNAWKYVADLVTEFDSTLPLVPCLAGEINQVVLNIIINAAQAIEDLLARQPGGRGTITIKTRRVDNWAEISISDTGGGIPDSVREKIFDPFFTTKEVGKGTGQGLPVARSVIVNKHKGSITFNTEVGRGTTFIIRLPLRAEEE